MAGGRQDAARAMAGLFFVMQTLAAGSPPAAREDSAAPEVLELKLAVEALRQQNDSLRERLASQEQRAGALAESLAIARTESDLFQRRWTEAHLRAQALGIDQVDAETKDWQRQLIESVRALYRAEIERQQLLEQLEAVVTAVETGDDQLPSILEQAGATMRAQQPVTGERRDRAEPAPTLATARVLDVNDGLQVAVLNVGRQHGARVGMPFVAFSGDRVTARLRVIEVRRHLCGALIEEAGGEEPLQAGQAARVTANR
jgi:hypothetical protein